MQALYATLYIITSVWCVDLACFFCEVRQGFHVFMHTPKPGCPQHANPGRSAQSAQYEKSLCQTKGQPKLIKKSREYDSKDLTLALYNTDNNKKVLIVDIWMAI